MKLTVTTVNGIFRVCDASGRVRETFTQRPDVERSVKGQEVEWKTESNFPFGLFSQLQEERGIRYFVETGTAWADTVEMVAPLVEKGWTVELATEQFQRASHRLKPYRHVHCLFGDSPSFLRQLRPWLDKPTLFWLDAHYSGGNTARGMTECPVLAELTALKDLPGRGHAILIDDRRLFHPDRKLDSIHWDQDWPYESEIEAALPWPRAIMTGIEDQILITKEL